MKKLLLIPALLSASVAFATPTKQIEISPMIGYDIAEGNLGFKDNGYMAYGLEVQLNSKDSSWSPELSAIFSNSGSAEYDTFSGGTNITRVAFNAVKTFDAMGKVIPFAKFGAGVEVVSTEKAGNVDSMFIDAGAGVKVPFTESISLKAEAIFMDKYNAQRYDSNLLVMAGLNFAFGDFAKKSAPVAVKPTPKPVKVVEKDSDKDGVLDSVDSCPTTPIGVKVDTKGCALDSDKDGVSDSVDSCPTTPMGVKVDAKGCELDSDKDGVLDSVDSCPTTPIGVKIDAKGCALDLDLDKDGVENSIDKCPNTPLNSRVDTEGCAEMVTLQVNFKSNSTALAGGSTDSIDSFVEFLKIQKTYKTQLVGYSDSRGNDAYNLKLSQRRASAVKDIIISKGIASDRVTSKGMGEANPVATNMTKAGRAQNRRIEAELIK